MDSVQLTDNSYLRDALRRNVVAVEGMLDQLLSPIAAAEGKILEAMRYACLGGGKRVRPFLVTTGASLFGVASTSALRVGCAVEMVHCYSLVHDDLPSMDDSDLRRGRPTAHKKFGEAAAVLAGDGLLTEAFNVLVDEHTHADGEVRAELVGGLAKAAGWAGMVGGQMIDIASKNTELQMKDITRLQRLKTGALITFSCESGAILGQAGGTERQALRAFGRDLGLAFQITDDLLDMQSTTEELGKPARKDTVANKATFVAILGVDGARHKAKEIANAATARLDIFGHDADLLRAIARFVVERRS